MVIRLYVPKSAGIGFNTPVTLVRASTTENGWMAVFLVDGVSRKQEKG